ncbi:KGK domain-containing protein [Chlorogloeopsis sp. ULAP02]|uniref:KGK domain-containing protein n=1 Tax=Chlorogloeopsis sp. ULAP02 TaxID=3107926 RepID=UPI0031359F5B
MTDKFIPLDCDDVVLLGKDTFKVSRLKDLVEQHIKQRLQRCVYESNSLEPGVSIVELFSLISLAEHQINLNEIQYNYSINGYILRIGSQGWQKGKLKIEVCISVIDSNLNQVYLEFHPEEIIEHDPLLDDIYKILSEN